MKEHEDIYSVISYVKNTDHHLLALLYLNYVKKNISL